jgi:hypothetical protein
VTVLGLVAEDSSASRFKNASVSLLGEAARRPGFPRDPMAGMRSGIKGFCASCCLRLSASSSSSRCFLAR